MIKITAPFSSETLKKLHAGDVVEISGTIYTARDAAHKKLDELLSHKQPMPINLVDAVIYYAGPSPAADGEIIGSIGPTTSARMDAYTPRLLQNGVKGLIGKGKRNDAVIKAIKAYSAVYFAAVGGAGAYYKSTVKSAETVAFPELMCEAIQRLEVEGFTAVVAIDSSGNSIY